MERESFEDPATAALMNELFVPVKVDREERPDVDQIYMDTVVRLHGHGGWPLTVFCTPDGRPFYGGTYFPPEPRHGLPAFRDVLRGVARAYREQRGQVDETARQILEALRARPMGVAQQLPDGASLRRRRARAARARRSRARGVRRRAEVPDADEPRAPPRRAATCCPRTRRRTCRPSSPTPAARWRGAASTTSSAAASTATASTATGACPHFEKMLYDQGQLLRVYADTWRRGGASDDDLVWPLRETARYLAREMRAQGGGFFASQDADSEGEEGKFYVWTPDEVRAVLGPERGDAFCAAYAVTPEGNFEHGTTVLCDVARRPRAELAAERERAATPRARGGSGRGRTASASPPGTASRSRASPSRARSSATTRSSPPPPRPATSSSRSSATATGGCCGSTPRASAQAARLPRRPRGDAGGRPRPPSRRGRRALARGRPRLRRRDRLPLLRPRGERSLPDARRRRAARPPAALGPRRRDAPLGGLRGARSAARRLARGPRRSPARGRARDPHPRVSPRARGPRLPDAPPRGGGRLARARRRRRGGRARRRRRPAPSPERARLALAPDDAVVVVAPGAAPGALDPSWLAGREPAGDRPTAWVCRGTACSLPVTDPAALASADALLGR